MIFTEREIAHCRSLDHPELGLCAAFCCKEAVLKAVGVPIDYRLCELLFRPMSEGQEVTLARSFLDEHDAGGCMARIVLQKNPVECVVAACVYRGR